MGSTEGGQSSNGDDGGKGSNKKEYRFSREFRSEMSSEKHQLVWKIEKFSALIGMAKETKSVIVESINFDAGESIGTGSKWRCDIRYGELKEEGGVDIVYDYDGISLYTRLIEYKGKSDKVFGQTNLTVKYPDDGKVFRCLQGVINERKKGKGKGCGWEKVVTHDELKKNKILVDDTLTLYIDFTIYGNKLPLSLRIDDEVGRKKMRVQMKEEVMRGFGALLENGLCADLIIKVPKRDDGANGQFRSFNVHKAVLSTHSPVFRAMLQTTMIEKETGEITVEDMSPKSMQLMLKFLYSGELDEDWMQVADEVILAAEKYHLSLLKDFCDKNLHQVITSTNAVKMLNLCKLYNLPHALKFVNDFIKINVSDLSSLFQPQHQ